MKRKRERGMLAPYRILDLTGEPGLMCGKLLADLGADVVKVEKPCGDEARGIGPFYHDEQDPEKSLYWFALNTNKRGITLNIEIPEGKALFLRLVRNADCVLESFPPGYLIERGLGYRDLCGINPEIIMTSITPFGPSGPYRDYKATDLTLWALSGLLNICGDPDRPPVRISLAQSYFHAAADAATGTAMALFHRRRTGEGQHVNVSILKAMERVAYTSHILWEARGRILRRPGSGLKIPPMGTTTPLIWPCRDGYVAFYLFGGAMGAVSNPALTQWMDEEGMASEVMKATEWPKFDIGRTPQEEMDREIVGPIRNFFKNHTQKELWDGGVRRRVMVYPVNDTGGVLNNTQLSERKFWVELDHAPLNDRITYPGPFVKAEGDLCQVRSVAPLVGEHNEEIFGEELGFSNEQITELKASQVI